MIATSLLWKLLAAALVSILPVKVQTNSGQAIEGELIEFTSDALKLDQGGKAIEIAFEDVASLIPDDVEPETGPTFRVTLVSGSKIQAQDLRIADGDLVIEPRRQNPLRVSVKQVKAIRFRAASTDTDAAWLGSLDRESRGDSLVIRRPGNKLDSQQGVVVSIQDGKVGFDLDGTVVNAPIDRLEGVVFGSTALMTVNPDIQVVDIWGSQWSAIDIEPSQGGQPLRLRLDQSITHEIPLHQVQSIRWSGGVTFLPAVEPVSESLQTYFQTNVDPNLVASFFGSRAMAEQNLRLFGGSTLEYRVEPGFQTFAGSIQRNAASAGLGSLIARVQLDGKVVWEQTLENSEPKGFELPLGDARRLAIQIDCGSDGDLGDQVLVIRPRLLK
jgi:hypothetical protein